MSVQTLQIAGPGLFTTVQDRGRYGYQRFGVPVSGAMDEFALRAANLLVGNNQGDAGLELTVLGPDVLFLTDTWIAVTGADLTLRLDGGPLPRWETVQVSKGSILSSHGMQDGMRAYLAVAGGIDVPVVMGSRSTYVTAAIGGFEGRALKKGDVISTLPSGPAQNEFTHRTLPTGYGPPTYGEHHEIRLILGPQDGAFAQEAVDTLLNSTYNISLDSDRMGYRLEGPAIKHRKGPDIVSDGNPLGAIQVPGDGIPTILLADRGTTGGYAKIATAISSDIGILAQGVPGQSVAFKVVSVEEAQRVLREREAILSAIAAGGQPEASTSGKISVLVDGEAFEVVDEDGEAVSEPQLGTEATRNLVHRARATVNGETYEFQVEVQRDDSGPA